VIPYRFLDGKWCSLTKEMIMSGVKILVQTLTAANGGNVAKVYWDGGWEEYVVRFFSYSSRLMDADYHTDDKEDALKTAEQWTPGSVY
jgi:hypothetical protein